ncbi:MAG: hypothetical protein ACP5UV_06745 [Thermoplasmata archaeon]
MISQFNINGKKIILFGGIKGLIRDGDDLRNALVEYRPDSIYIVLTQEQIDGLKSFIKDPFELSLSDYEISYGLHLSVYGEVMTPPPIYIEAVKYSEENDVKILPLDVPEDDYQDHYTRSVRTFDLIHNSLRKRKIIKMEFGDKTPEDFVEKWNAMMQKVKGLRLVDEYRLRYIKEQIDLVLKKDTKDNIIFIVTEYEFYRDLENQIGKFNS